MDGWDYDNGRCYKKLIGQSTYQVAKIKCEALNSVLPTIESASNAYFVETVSGVDDTWIGLTDRSQEGVWEWESGSNSSYRKWSVTRPDGGSSQNCGVIDGSGIGWDDRSCVAKNKVVCDRGNCFFI